METVEQRVARALHEQDLEQPAGAMFLGAGAAGNTFPDLNGAKEEGVLFQQPVTVASQESARWISQSPWSALVDRHSTKLAVAVVMVAISAFLVTQASLEIARTRKDELGVCVQTGGSYINGNCINTQQRAQ